MSSIKEQRSLKTSPARSSDQESLYSSILFPAVMLRCHTMSWHHFRVLQEAATSGPGHLPSSSSGISTSTSKGGGRKWQPDCTAAAATFVFQCLPDQKATKTHSGSHPLLPLNVSAAFRSGRYGNHQNTNRQQPPSWSPISMQDTANAATKPWTLHTIPKLSH